MIRRAARRTWVAVFRLALRLHPPRRRARYSEEAVEAFEESMERRAGLRAHRYAARAVGDALVAGWFERRRAAGGSGSGRIGARGWRPVETLGTDARRAVRRSLRAPGFTAAVTGILALGVGANAAVFTVLRNAVLAPLPFPDAQRLVLPRWSTTSAGAPDTAFSQWSYPKFSEFRDATTDVFDGFVGYAVRSAAVTDPGRAESVPFEFVTPGYFELLGATPVAGRFFVRDDGGALDPPREVVLSHAFWVERFGADRSAVGRTITADGARLEIVGVAPPGFQGLTGSPELWIPLVLAREAYGPWATEDRGMHWFHALGRLRPGLSATAAEERVLGPARQIDAVESRLTGDQRIGVDVAPLASVWANPQARTSLWLAMGAALLVLGIAVANVAALFLARGRREARETAVRLALGAGKGRLVTERLTEGVLVAGAGGGLGIVLAAWAMASLRSAVPTYLFRGAGGDILLVGEGALGLDGPAALFGLGVALLAGALFGVAPTLAQGTVDLVPALRRGGFRTVGRRDGSGWLVGGQVALSVLLLICAGLLLATLRGLHDEQRGFDPEGLVVLRYSLGGPGGRYDAPEVVRAFHRSMRDRALRLPGVRSAVLGTTPPLSGHFVTTRVSGVIGREPYAEGERPRAGVHVVGGGFFDTMGTELLRGRSFTPSEFDQAEYVTVISERAAEELFPGEDPLGREVDLGFSPADEDYAFRVVGVVEDVLYSAPVEGVMPELYLPMGVWSPLSMALLVRTEGDDAGAVVAGAREILSDLDPDVPFWRVTTGDELRVEDVADTRLLLIVLGTFAGLAVLLSSAGLWAVVARAVAERRREIGVRVALGARVRQVEALVFRQGLGPIAGGGCVGLVLAAVLSPRLERILFGVQPRNPLIYVGATVLLLTVALLATWVPARRAAQVDPTEALAGD